MNKKIIITGHKGFVGSYLFNLLQQFYTVYGIDLQDGNDIFNINGLTGIDIVIHCAALTSVTESFKKPDDYYRTNILGTTHLANLCLKNNVQLIYISSAAIFEPFSSPYAESKAAAHTVLNCFIDVLRLLTFIPYNIYSVKPKKESLMGKFLNSPEIIIYGNGKQTRDFINIIDIGAIIKTAIDEEWESETIELGTGIATTVNEVADIFANETMKQIVHIKKSGGIKHSTGNISHLREHYTKPFKTNLKKDIAEMVRSLN